MNIKYVPNILTLIRILIVPFFIVSFLNENFSIRILSIILFFLGSFSDFLDGYIARKYNLVTNFGKIIDPLADKILILAAFFILNKMYPTYVPLWMVSLILLRDLIITYFRFYFKKKNFILKTSIIAKRKTLFQIIIIHLLLIFHVFKESIPFDINLSMQIIYFSMLMCVIFTVFTGLHYLFINRYEV